MRLTARSSRFVTVALALALAAGLTACGGDDSAPASGSEIAGETGDGAQAITVDHMFGSTEVTGVPQRVVTIDLQWTDVMLAMGVEPVGYSVDSFMPETGVPWQDLPADAVGLPLDDGPPIEQIAELQPDLIVGSYSIADEGVYDQLSGIAPTIAGLDAQQVTPWQDLLRTAGEILGEPDRAEEIIADVDGEVDAVAADLPGLEGKTFTLAQYIVGDSIYAVADEQDGSSVFFQQLGMTMYGPVKDEGESSGDTRIIVSTERSDLLQADLLAFLVNGGDESDLADIPGFDQLPGTVAVLDYPTIVGLNTPSPLSLPYSLEQLRPYLEEASGGPGAG
ncbi:ABC transporter substrate-binding protein [Jiangella mangrovi]|uniref:Iron complex transport system substrate-binding protein n=1 Tax=Jiangella mangrovi TaxID=1524084 RepID=A0A7W9LNB1_9ACTN|nr:ABC transporter substrate-binding protein [Jiangella mangrovi]MBB5790138.1 iron complex transport system substrate-binding protein [Jiangella mangrovi]